MWKRIYDDRLRNEWDNVEDEWRRGRILGKIDWYDRKKMGRWIRGGMNV